VKLLELAQYFIYTFVVLRWSDRCKIEPKVLLTPRFTLLRFVLLLAATQVSAS